MPEINRLSPLFHFRIYICHCYVYQLVFKNIIYYCYVTALILKECAYVKSHHLIFFQEYLFLLAHLYYFFHCFIAPIYSFRLVPLLLMLLLFIL